MLCLLSKILLICSLYPCPVLYAQKPQPTRKIPVIESRAEGDNDYYIILLTGNGGWKDLVKSVTGYLNLKNVSVAAINTKKYMFTKKEPAQIACDLETLIEKYNEKWGKQKVVLIGYSMGAEVLPFAINLLEDKYIEELSDFILIGPWLKATFRIKLLDYIYVIEKGDDIYSELLKMKTRKGYIICDDVDKSICRKNLDNIIDYDILKGGHHFGENYDTLSGLICKRLKLE